MKSKKTQLSSQVVKHIAQLASLGLSETEIKKFQKQLSEIISYINKLNELETGETEPVSQVTGLVNVTKEDKIEDSRMFSQEEVLRNARSKKNGFIKVKSILE